MPDEIEEEMEGTEEEEEDEEIELEGDGDGEIEIPAEEELNPIPIYEGVCKHFHQEPYMTPNNYDLTFDHNNIPSNIQPETASSLQNRLQKLMPTSKIIHLKIGENQTNQTNFLRIHSRMKVNGQEVKFI